MMDQTVAILVVVSISGIIIAVTVIRSRAVLESWAAENGYELLTGGFRLFRRGPFFWTSSKGQTVHRVVVRTSEGQVMQGWVRCGSIWGVLFSDKVEVRWDENEPFSRLTHL